MVIIKGIFSYNPFFLKNKFLICILLLFFGNPSFSQTDTTQVKTLVNQILKILDDTAKSRFNRDYTFDGTRLESETKPSKEDMVELSAYLDAYYARYLDTNDINGFQKFPTLSPRNNSFGLNMALISMKLNSHNFRGNIVLHYGDVPQSAWSTVYNLIQESNVGIKLSKKLWLDAGLFRTHFGLESVQSRENITTSMALTTFFEPYFLSGAKLSYHVNDKLMIQANVFNGFNTFVENNNSKAFGLSTLYNFSDKITFTFNTITCDESSIGTAKKHQRLYNDLLVTYKGEKYDIGYELNYGFQQNSNLANPNKTAQMVGTLISVRRKINSVWSVYMRNEYFNDKSEILTGPLQNSKHGIVGIESYGFTSGIEFKPSKTSFIRFENRYLKMAKYDDFFFNNGRFRNKRFEFMINTGVWL